VGTNPKVGAAPIHTQFSFKTERVYNFGMNKHIKIKELICGPDFDLFEGDEVTIIRDTDLNDAEAAYIPPYKMYRVRVTKCDSEPEMIGVEGEFMIDATGELVSY